MAFVDPAIGWFELAEITDKTSVRITQIFNNTWLPYYPIPRKDIFDNGDEFERKTSYLSSKTLALSLHLQSSRIIKPIVCWKEYIKS